MRMYDVVALGELLIDFVHQGNNDVGYPLMQGNPGGAPGNFLSTLSKFGAKTGFLGKVGSDRFGRMLVKTFRDAGVETKGILVDDRYFTTLAFVTLDDSGDREFSFARKPGADTMLTIDELPKDLVTETKVFHFGTLSMTGEPARSTTKEAVRMAKEAGAMITFDPNLRRPLWSSMELAREQMLWGLRHADVVKIGQDELEFIFEGQDFKDSAKKLFEQDEDSYDEDLSKYDRGNAYDETWLPITTTYYLYLSGTPFRALNSGEFIEEQIYNWTYSDEQRAKENWVGEDNPYAALPRMVMLTYKIPDSIQQIAKQGEFDEFDLNVFFSAEGTGKDAHFKYEDYVQKWLDLIRGSYLETTVDELKLGAEKPPMPFSDTRLLNVLNHTLWFLPNVASCYAMANLLAQRQNAFYHDYTVNVCAGTEAGIGVKAVEPVRRSMGDPLSTKTITLSCGKLTTGVTIKPWTGIFMLRNLSSPETYFQAAFRVQSPWEITDDSGKKQIIKKECYVFDFALDRALKQISDYSCRLNVEESNPEKKVGEFINFLPVLAYDGSAMRQVNAAEILDIAMAGTSATLLAKRWESALLVNVDNETLARLLANKDAMDALMRIEGFRSLNDDIETIINKSEAVKKAKKESDKLTPKQKKELSEEEKEYKSKRKMIQEKLIKFATRVPVFMYLTDYREYSLKDVITQLEPELFKKVTGLNVKDFELLVSLNVFNEALMNDAVYKFKRYEDASLSYTGIDRHAGESVGLYSTVLSRQDYDMMAGQLVISEVAEAPKPEDLPTIPTFSEAEEEEEEQIPATVEQKPAQLSERKPITAPNEPSLRKTPTYRPAYTPPTIPIAHKAKTTAVDTSHIGPGSMVTHKAFGTGKVTAIEKGVITVSFDGLEKKFQFPGAFQQGFLRETR